MIPGQAHISSMCGVCPLKTYIEVSLQRADRRKIARTSDKEDEVNADPLMHTLLNQFKDKGPP